MLSTSTIYPTLTHWDAMLGSKKGHLFDVFIGNVGRDDQDGWIGVTQLITAVNLTDSPALIWKTLEKHDENFLLLYITLDLRLSAPLMTFSDNHSVFCLSQLFTFY